MKRRRVWVVKLTNDDIAGIAEMFGVISRKQLEQALIELSYRQGEELSETAAENAVQEALSSFALVAISHQPQELTAGPAAYPTLPVGANDLPHMLEQDRQKPDPAVVREAANQRYREAVDEAIEASDTETLQDLLQLSYDIEAWAEITVDDVRSRIQDEL